MVIIGELQTAFGEESVKHRRALQEERSSDGGEVGKYNSEWLLSFYRNFDTGSSRLSKLTVHAGKAER